MSIEQLIANAKKLGFNEIYCISDKDFGIEPEQMHNPVVRLAARGIIINNDGKIGVMNKRVKNEFKLIGGGLEGAENFEEGFKRECLEEAGCEVDITKKLGYTVETKTCHVENSEQKGWQQLSLVVVAQTKNAQQELNLSRKEKDEDAVFLWLDPDEALKKMKGCINELRDSKYRNVYMSRFMVLRDIKIVEAYKALSQIPVANARENSR